MSLHTVHCWEMTKYKALTLDFLSCSSHQFSNDLNAVFSIIFLLKSRFNICFSSEITLSITPLKKKYFCKCKSLNSLFYILNITSSKWRATWIIKQVRKKLHVLQTSFNFGTQKVYNMGSNGKLIFVLWIFTSQVVFETQIKLVNWCNIFF